MPKANGLAVVIYCLLVPVIVSAQIVGSQVEAPPHQSRLRPQKQQSLGSSSQTQEIPILIPKEFRGCWLGTFRYPSDFRQLNTVPLGGWFSVTYDLCFKWNSNGEVTVTLNKAKNDLTEAARYGIEDYQEPVSVVAVEPEGVVKLHGTARFFNNGAEIVDENDLVCRLLGDGRGLDVERTQLAICSGIPSAGCNGSPWYRATWGAQFTRISK
jgi:hypothetical protein